MVQIWYPAQPAGSATRAPYIEDPTVLVPLGRLLHMPASLFGYLRYVKTSAIQAAPVSDAESCYPVLVFAHGRGGIRQHNTFQVEELVSRGYVVAAIDHPYAASTVIFPDGRRAVYDPRMNDRPFHDSVIPYLVKDVSFTLDQLAVLDQADPNHILTGRLDLKRLGVCLLKCFSDKIHPSLVSEDFFIVVGLIGANQSLGGLRRYHWGR